MIDLSPYKYRSRGGRGRAAHVIEVGVPEQMEEAAIEAEMRKLQAGIDGKKAQRALREQRRKADRCT